MGCEGARKRSITRLRTAKSCAGARSESRRPKRYKNWGFLTSQKLSKNCFFSPGGALRTKNGTRRRFSIGLGLPRRSSNSAVFWVSAIWPRFRVWWRFWAALFFYKKLLFENLQKKINVEKNGAKLMFSSHVSDHFWCTVSGGAPTENATFGPLGAVPKSLLCRFGVGPPPSVPCCGGNSHSLSRFARLYSEMSLNVAGFDLVGHQPPGNCGNKRLLAWGGGSLYDLPKLCRNKWQVHHKIRFWRVEVYDRTRFFGELFFCLYVFLLFCLGFGCSALFCFVML